MARYLKKAHKLDEKIRYFYDHSGFMGYDQSIYYYNELIYLMLKAKHSNKYKDEAPIINVIKKDIDVLINEMKLRKQHIDN